MPRMPPRRLAALLTMCLGLSAACSRPPAFQGPRSLLQRQVAGGPRVGSVTLEGDARPALLETASFQTALPARPLLTFGIGCSFPSGTEPPGWLRVQVRAAERVLAERTLNPRALRGWRDLSVPLDGLGSSTTLTFSVALSTREGQPIPVPPDMVLAVSEPVIHDLDAYGRAKGIVLVSIDTLRRDHVGAYGYAPPTTPRLDALAREGLIADDAVSVSSWTLPSHVSMLTSVDPAIHGGTDMRHGFGGGVPALPALLKSAGFATQAVTSHLYVSSVYGLDHGFDRLDFHQDRRATDVANRAIDLVDRFGDRPFFLFLHFYDPHWHYDPPEAVRALFGKPYAGAITGLWGDFSKRTPASVSRADLDHLLALYDGEIRYTDDEVGRVLDHLSARGALANTLVLVTSDHGEEFLEHGSWEHQKTLYEEVVRIPLIARGPGISARRETAPVTLLDVAPTILAWAGVAAPASFQGRSLLAPVSGDREAYGETDHTVDGSHKLFLRAGARRWKAILSLDPSGGSVRGEEWYDLAADPSEKASARPPAAASDAIRARALARWKRGRGTSASSARPVCLTAEQKERLRALGYVHSSGDAACPAEVAR
jgi:arylsulfatase A-like enzyme